MTTRRWGVHSAFQRPVLVPSAVPPISESPDAGRRPELHVLRMEIFWTVVTFAVVIAIGLWAVWAFLIEPFRVPHHHAH